MNSNFLTIYNGAVITRREVIKKGFVKVKAGKIVEVGSGTYRKADLERAIDAKGNYIVPGFIDLHTHGGGGASVMEAEAQALDKMAEYKFSQGVTGFLATTLTASPEKLKETCQTVADYMKSSTAKANLWGVHLEGPYLNYQQRGAHCQVHLRTPDLEEFKAWQQILGAKLKLLTLAPELEGAAELIKHAQEAGVVVAAGHTAASYRELQQAIDWGVSQGTHLFNGMAGFHHRQPGPAGACLNTPGVSVELIVDGQHLHWGAVDLVLKAKDLEKIILVTDSISATGLGDGNYNLGDLEVQVKSGVARLQSGALAGSLLTLREALRNIVAMTKLNLVEAVKLVTLNPARSLGIASQKGSLSKGKDADLVIFDQDFDIKLTLLEGRVVYNSLF
ncbi:N-acetylglucosamine-6-phosphate deacetylase [Fuchsiella alkaliacetigena]|uniref:N-acetylglucosamine-6-phosphate deacetylase n=1 Tax=Fuchsiella alkaliacetigena TaxID=957042 RepID=UPI00200A2485|nr:N-acetylglucosamine-6-phosphate deacetylase [Fuchsiella alkaliacetigena]MCK8824079.1 N-acetylglucosamine-6-phosphate deacetylase [Fuchsiella alkaliacetigena]